MHCVYQDKTTCANSQRAMDTISNIQELRSLLAKLKREGTNPRTGRHIIVFSYTTATKRCVAKPPALNVTAEEGLVLDNGDESELIEAIEAEGDDREDPRDPIGTLSPVRVLFDAEFHMVVADECHYLKSRKSTIHRMVKQLPREGLLLVSATPISNHLRDIGGYLGLLWNPRWPFGFNRLGETPDSARFYEPGSLEALLAMESYEGIDYDRLFLGPSAQTPVVAEGDLAHHEEYRAAVETRSLPLWILNPDLFNDYATRSSWSAEFSQYAVGRIFSMLMLRRNMMSEFTLPDGTVTAIGQGMPLMTIKTVELRPHRSITEETFCYLEEKESKLWTTTPASQGTHVGRGSFQEKPKAMINPNIHRQLQLASIDTYNRILTAPTARTIRFLKDFEGAVALARSGLPEPLTVVHVPATEKLSVGGVGDTALATLNQ